MPLIRSFVPSCPSSAFSVLITPRSSFSRRFVFSCLCGTFSVLKTPKGSLLRCLTLPSCCSTGSVLLKPYGGLLRCLYLPGYCSTCSVLLKLRSNLLRCLYLPGCCSTYSVLLTPCIRLCRCLHLPSCSSTCSVLVLPRSTLRRSLVSAGLLSSLYVLLSPLIRLLFHLTFTPSSGCFSCGLPSLLFTSKQSCNLGRQLCRSRQWWSNNRPSSISRNSSSGNFCTLWRCTSHSCRRLLHNCLQMCWLKLHRLLWCHMPTSALALTLCLPSLPCTLSVPITFSLTLLWSHSLPASARPFPVYAPSELIWCFTLICHVPLSWPLLPVKLGKLTNQDACRRLSQVYLGCTTALNYPLLFCLFLFFE